MAELTVYVRATGDAPVAVVVPMMATVGDLEEEAKKVLKKSQVTLAKDGEELRDRKAVLADLGVCSQSVLEVLPGFRVTIADRSGDGENYHITLDEPPTGEVLHQWVDTKWKQMSEGPGAASDGPPPPSILIPFVSHTLTTSTGVPVARTQERFTTESEFEWTHVSSIPMPPQVIYGRPYVPNDEAIMLSKATKLYTPGGVRHIGNNTPKGKDDHSVEAARQWAAQAAEEAVSVASFAALTLRLMANGAPHILLDECLRAGQDEIQHAKMCRQLARKYKGETGEEVADKLPAHDLSVQPGLADLAERAVREGGIGETLAAASAALGGWIAKDPEVKAVQSQIAADESRHAALAWAVAVWACSRPEGGEARAALRKVLEEEEAKVGEIGEPPEPRVEGRVEGGLLAAVAQRSRVEVCIPLLRAMADGTELPTPREGGDVVGRSNAAVLDATRALVGAFGE
eukprot:Hpha_TRINITY_DN35149_c0_g1::TRINITY_DN35149_c0_g1_i1::g.168374::m.168374